MDHEYRFGIVLRMCNMKVVFHQKNCLEQMNIGGVDEFTGEACIDILG